MSHVEPISWWARNKGWFFPLLIILGCIGAFILVICTIIYFVVGAVKKSEPYLLGLEIAKKNAEIVALMGEPIEEGFFVGGNTPAPNEQGMIDMSIPLTGPKGSGVVLIVGQKLGDDWKYSRILFRSNETTAVVDLRPQAVE
ncbi:cytochrome c oxidase assembly factor 1 family protein [Bartonella sp. HY329]|uniref:cytochrome c oxidase assembly factor 1 family protein n=1 Tax=unclassified Bartonella TaxID=2645622 RepID=UPI0021C8FEFB|nr:MULTISPECIES: cytochrome c oxidase assembly factor 1 family protein [unclassified Bartonella]UXM94093.1 cytochrome c oxidase assembly factor 1 family protein [Bartonella sp. HY329]UXN08415.1 cytochrome c oxidase assembly factor 1 family protein [Bartonella sp. HY328]